MRFSCKDIFSPSPDFYDGYRLLSYNDRENKKPELYFSTSNRCGGKTTFFQSYFIHRFLKKGKKFFLLYRTQNELTGVAEAIQKNSCELFFSGLKITEKQHPSKSFSYLYVSDGEKTENCGYCIAINSSEKIKKFSQLLSDVTIGFFDEFQTTKYLKDEVEKFFSIHTSLAREKNLHKKHLPVILAANLLDRFNPYYEKLGICENLDINCNFFRGKGFVIEQHFNEKSALLHSESGIAKAMSTRENILNSTKKYSLENNFFIDGSIKDFGIYIMTIKYDRLYSVRYIEEENIFYISDKPDLSCKKIVAASLDNVGSGAVNSTKWIMKLYQKMKEDRVRFKNRSCRIAFFAAIKKQDC